MDILLRIAIAIALIAAMVGLRMLSSRAIFQFRISNGFRAHECDGTCASHRKEQHAAPADSKRM